MKKVIITTIGNSYYYVIILVILTISTSLPTTHAENCTPGKPIIGPWVPPGRCDPRNPECCKPGQSYATYECSPPVNRANNRAILTLSTFERAPGRSGPTTCDGWFQSDNMAVVSLSTGWFNRGSRCGKEIVIHGNGKTTKAKVVDECDSRRGCDARHGYKVPCKNNVVGASKAVWSNLGVTPNKLNQYVQLQITWSDA